MEKSEIIKGNKLIAGFMGLHFHKIGWVDAQHIDGNYECEVLQYNYSWDWLMPVANKIKITVMNKAVEVISAKLHGNINVQLMSVEIENVYKAVVDFIESYNNLKK